jgi:tRNA-2-methylthio-N6-dimethylallyladenosine synthase
LRGIDAKDRWFHLGSDTTFYVETFGCQMNERDSETISALLSDHDMVPVDSPNEADVIILNTCAVRESAESKVWSRLGRLAAERRGDEPVFVLAGCMAQLPSTLDRVRQRMPFVKVLAGPGNIHRIPELVKEARQVTVRAREQSGTCMEDRPRRGLLTAVSPGRTAANRDESTQILPEGLPRSNIPGVTAYVTIMYGCDNFCSYCIVPYVRGPQISRLPGDVLREVRGLVDRGYKEITLLGQNVNAFGLDRKYLAQPAPNEAGIAYDFASLLREINTVAGLERIRYFTSHPRDFTKEMVDAARECDKVCEHFHLPLQSGSDRILRIMNRGYTKEEYLSLARYIEETVPGASITTDIIVGFPGETEDDFQETLDVVRRVKFDGAFTFVFSPRKGTPAAKMKGQVPKDEKSRRLQHLVEVQSKITLERNLAMIGEAVQVLVESHDADDKRIVRGRTRTNKMVLAESQAPLPEPGSLVQVTVKEAGVWYLRGSIEG